MLKLFILLTMPFFWIACLAGPAKADQWGSVVFAHCYALDGSLYDRHFFIRVFWTEIGGGQLSRQAGQSQGPTSLYDLSSNPSSCVIDERDIRFEVIDFRPRTIADQSEKTGFRLTIDNETVWETPSPVPRGARIFNGTIDVDRDMVRVCTERTPEDVGVALPYRPDFFQSRTSILVCEAIAY